VRRSGRRKREERGGEDHPLALTACFPKMTKLTVFRGKLTKLTKLTVPRGCGSKRGNRSEPARARGAKEDFTRRRGGAENGARVIGEHQPRNLCCRTANFGERRLR
jgi:hypothetical protein